MSTLFIAVRVVTDFYHAERSDKAEELMARSLGAMYRVKKEEGMIVALLHGMMGYSGAVNLLNANGFDEDIIQALERVTRLPGEERDYGAFIQRICSGPTLSIVAEIANLSESVSSLKRRLRRNGIEEREVSVDILKGELQSRGETVEDWLTV